MNVIMQSDTILKQEKISSVQRLDIASDLYKNKQSCLNGVKDEQGLTFQLRPP